MKATNIHARFVGLALGTMTLAASVASLVQAQEAPIATNAPAAEPSTAQPPAPAGDQRAGGTTAARCSGGAETSRGPGTG